MHDLKLTLRQLLQTVLAEVACMLQLLRVSCLQYTFWPRATSGPSNSETVSCSS